MFNRYVLVVFVSNSIHWIIWWVLKKIIFTENKTVRNQTDKFPVLTVCWIFSEVLTLLKIIHTGYSRKSVNPHQLFLVLQEIEKPRGRKRGVASTDDQDSKPKRGRKKAAANTTSAADSEDQWDEDNRPEDEQNSPPKKGRRGRPPKSATPSQDTPTKGKRGRKKAAPPPEDDEEEEEEEEERMEEEGEDEEEDDDRSSENMEVKTKGGRQARAPRRSQG